MLFLLCWDYNLKVFIVNIIFEPELFKKRPWITKFNALKINYTKKIIDIALIDQVVFHRWYIIIICMHIFLIKRNKSNSKWKLVSECLYSDFFLVHF